MAGLDSLTKIAALSIGLSSSTDLKLDKHAFPSFDHTAIRIEHSQSKEYPSLGVKPLLVNPDKANGMIFDCNFILTYTSKDNPGQLNKTNFNAAERNGTEIEFINKLRGALSLEANGKFDEQLEAAIVEYKKANKVKYAPGEAGNINIDFLNSLRINGDIVYCAGGDSPFQGFGLYGFPNANLKDQKTRAEVFNKLLNSDEPAQAHQLEQSLIASNCYKFLLEQVKKDIQSDPDPFNKQKNNEFISGMIQLQAGGVEFPARIARNIAFSHDLLVLSHLHCKPENYRHNSAYISPHSDHNGGLSRFNGSLVTDLVLWEYNCKIIDAYKDSNIRDGIQNLCKDTGKKLDLLRIGGHGAPDSVLLSDQDSLDISKELDTVDFKLQSYLNPNSIVILQSCFAYNPDKPEESNAYKLSRLAPESYVICGHFGSSSIKTSFQKDNHNSAVVSVPAPNAAHRIYASPRSLPGEAVYVLKNGEVVETKTYKETKSSETSWGFLTPFKDLLGAQKNL